MEVKKTGSPHSILSLFDLLGNDEVALSKAFAFILGKELDALGEFFKFLGIRKRITDNSFRRTQITTEYHRNEGRTDVEIQLGNDVHIIIESKVRKNRIKEQRTQYLTAFNKKATHKIMVFLTQERDSNFQHSNNIKIINASWLDITNLYDQKRFLNNELVLEFLKYVSKNYLMNQQKEILIQDLSDQTELIRYKNHRLYRRDQTFGTPLYFAPYFTRNAKQPEGEGIAYLSKILGVITLVPSDIHNYETELLKFKNDSKSVNNWIKGVLLSDVNSEPMTFYFLDDPVRLNKNLMKDGGTKKGRGKNWIAAMIPKNRCVTFEEFTRRMNT